MFLAFTRNGRFDSGSRVQDMHKIMLLYGRRIKNNDFGQRWTLVLYAKNSVQSLFRLFSLPMRFAGY